MQSDSSSLWFFVASLVVSNLATLGALIRKMSLAKRSDGDLLNGSRDKINQALGQCQSSIDNMESDLKSLSTDLSVLRAALPDLYNQIRTQQQSLAVSNKDIERHELEINEWRIQARENEKNIHNLQLQLAGMGKL